MRKRHVLITGGGGDLAREMSRQFDHANYTVLAPTREEMDVTDTESIRSYFRQMLGLDLLINNAAILRDSTFLRMEEADWEAVLQTNLTGAFRCCREALPYFLEAGGGHIINIGSFSALHPPFGQAPYAAAKAGLIALTQSLALEHGGDNVRANCVLPGFLETKMSRAAWERNRSEILAAHCLDKLNRIEDAARFMVFLDSMENVSGQVFQLDSRITPWT